MSIANVMYFAAVAFTVLVFVDLVFVFLAVAALAALDFTVLALAIALLTSCSKADLFLVAFYLAVSAFFSVIASLFFFLSF